MIASVISTPQAAWTRPIRTSGSGGDRYTPSGTPDFVPPTRAQLLSAFASPPAFPGAWQGRWKGEMEVSGVPGTDSVGVELEIRPRGEDGRHSWTIRYQGMPERNYDLVPVDPARGHYVVDEHNGILLDSYYDKGVLLSQFEVDKNRVSARYEMQGDQLAMELNMFRREPVREGAHGVRVFELGSLQKTRLQRQPD